MFSFLKNQWFLIAVAAASLLAYNWPEWGLVLHNFDIISVAIVLSFFATGLSLETQSVLRQVKEVRAPIAALFSSLILYPLLAWAAALPLLPSEFVIGICIIGTAPVTISSGTIMTTIARGNVPLSLLICILSNFLAIFTIPVMLNVLLNFSSEINLPVRQMLLALVLKVLLPLVLGNLLRPLTRELVRRSRRQISVFQSTIIILIIFNAVSTSAENLHEIGSSIGAVLAFMLCLNLAILAINYGIAGLIRLDRPATIAFTIHTSQKTLAVSYIIWAGYFAADFPTAFVPAIVCQLTQMVLGTVVANYFRTRG